MHYAVTYLKHNRSKKEILHHLNRNSTAISVKTTSSFPQSDRLGFMSRRQQTNLLSAMGFLPLCQSVLWFGIKITMKVQSLSINRFSRLALLLLRGFVLLLATQDCVDS